MTEAGKTPDGSMTHSLETEDQYRTALARVRRYFDVEPRADTREADIFDALCEQIARYEAAHFPIKVPRNRVC